MYLIICSSLTFSYFLQVQNGHVIEQLLSSEYLASNVDQQRQFCTLLLSNTLEELKDTNLSLGSLSQNNLTQFVVTLVDKLWQGLYTAPAMNVVQFISFVLCGSAQSGPTSLAVRNYDLIKSLGRATLFVLSRDTSVDAAVAQADKLQCLHLLISTNADQVALFDGEVLSALTYCLSQLAAQCPVSMETVSIFCAKISHFLQFYYLAFISNLD